MNKSMKKAKLMILGNARHGKDTVCQILHNEYDYNFISSSEAALDAVIWPSLRHTYKDKHECFKDRVNHRALWFRLIEFYNSVEPTRLALEIYSQADIYCGLRSRREFEAAKSEGLFDYVVWVDASQRREHEPSSSMELSRDDADFTIYNNGTLDEFKVQVKELLGYMALHEDAA